MTKFDERVGGGARRTVSLQGVVTGLGGGGGVDPIVCDPGSTINGMVKTIPGTVYCMLSAVHSSTEIFLAITGETPGSRRRSL